MSKLFLRAALAGCATAAVAAAQPQAPTPPPIAVAPPVPVPTMVVRGIPMAPDKLVLKAFDVADLVCPPADSPLAKPGRDPAMIAAAKAFAEVRGEELLTLARATGNRIGVEMLSLTTDGRTLVVSGSEAVADRVGACVESLRKLRNSQVKVDLTVFTVPSGNEAMVKLFGDKGTAAVKMDEFNVLLQELKASGAADVLTRPTLVMQNKQTGFCQTGQAVPAAGCPTACATVGLTSRVTPEVSADLKSILLAMELQHTTPARGQLGGIDCQETKTNVVLPDGGTILVKVGTWKQERRSEQKVPVMSDIPYLDRLFRNVRVTNEPTDVVAVVTATRLADAPCVVSQPVAIPPVAVAPPMMPTAVPYTATLRAPFPAPTQTPVALPLTAQTPVMPPMVRTVGADGLERVGVNFDALTKPTPTQPPQAVWVFEGQRLATPTPNAVWKAAPAGVSFTRFVPSEGPTVAGGMVGVTLSRATESDDTADLMAKYKAACAAGHREEATRLAVKLLAKDPTCFGK